jgi:hypothetical protein
MSAGMKILLVSVIVSLFGLILGIGVVNDFTEKKPETVTGSKPIYRNNYGQPFIRDTIFIHDTLYKWNIDTSRIKIKRTKLLCVDAYGTEGLGEGNIYTTSGNKFTDEDGVVCFYIDGVGPKKASRFTRLLETSIKN